MALRDSLARERVSDPSLLSLLHSTRCGYARVPEEHHEIAPGLLERQEADPARSRDWFPRRAVTSALARDVIGLATRVARRTQQVTLARARARFRFCATSTES